MDKETLAKLGAKWPFKGKQAISSTAKNGAFSCILTSVCEGTGDPKISLSSITQLIGGRTIVILQASQILILCYQNQVQLFATQKPII